MIELVVCPFDENIGVLYQSNGNCGLVGHRQIRGYKTIRGAYDFLQKVYLDNKQELRFAYEIQDRRAIEILTNNSNVIHWQMGVLENLQEV